MPVSPFDIARAHVRLPITQSGAALKSALRDWLRYTEQTPLPAKAAFPATLSIEVRRPAPSAISRAHGSGGSSSPPSQRRFGAASFATGLAAWRRRHTQQQHSADSEDAGSSGAAAHLSPSTPSVSPLSSSAGRGADAAPPHVYRFDVPLQLYTALLPWEVQRGLSLTTLAPPSPVDPKQVGEDDGKVVDAAAAATTVKDANKTAQDCAAPAAGEEEEDPYGVVTPPSPRTDAAAPAGEVSAVPGMLFVLDLKGVREHGQISFWSGAITRPIDILFFAPMQAPSVAASAALQRVRRRDVAMQVESNEIAPGVVEAYFPNNELQSERYTLKLHTHGHLDPFPWIAQQQHDANVEGEEAAGGGEPCFSVEAPLTRENRRDTSTSPRFVVEAVRRTMHAAMERALVESIADYRRVHGDAAAAYWEEGLGSATAGVEVDVSLHPSGALTADLLNKAQLATSYVAMLEEGIQAYARQLSRPYRSDAAHEPLSSHEEPGAGEDWGWDAGDAAAGGASSSSSSPPRRMQVWLSETEQVWMTAAELAQFQREQAMQQNQPPWGAEAGDDGDEEDADSAAFMRAGDGEEVGAVVPAAAEEPSGIAPTPQEARGVAEADGDDSGFVTPPRVGATRADRSIARQSPMLAAEAEGRPDYLAPSFTGRHEAATLRGSAVVSADRLARYPPTRSEMPVLPPIDYELLDLCLRLGVGQAAVLHTYYERIQREWRVELLALRTKLAAAARAKKAAAEKLPPPQPGSDAEPTIGATDLERMRALVHDPSLQVPEELRSLVDAVVAAKKRLEDL